MMTLSSAHAQHAVSAVVPGCDGDLPAPPTIEQAEPGHFGGLILKSVFFDKSDYRWLAELQFPVLPNMGDGTFDIQYMLPESEDWASTTKYYFNTVRFPGSDHVKYRLVIKGGPMDGYVSNTVIAVKPQKRFHVGIGYSEPNFIAVGNDVYAHYVDISLISGSENNWTHKDVNRAETMQHYHYEWFRQNPNTGDVVLIEGQNDRIYTPTLEDVGYELVSVIYGDDSFADFYTQHSHGKVRLPILTSMALLNAEGAIINTNYVLPDPEKNLWIFQSTGEENKNVPFESVKTIKPGQYSVRLKTEENMYMPWGYGDFPYILCMSSPNWDSFREFFLMDQMPLPIPVIVQKDGQNMTDATIDVLAMNLDGNFEVSKTVTAEAGSERIIVNLPAGTYYFMAHKTATTANTYYPGALSLDKAEAVTFNEMDYYEKFTDPSFAFIIQAQEPSEGNVVDFNEDGDMNVTDVVTLISCIAKNDFTSVSKEAADVNGDGEVNVTDVVTLIIMIATAN